MRCPICGDEFIIEEAEKEYDETHGDGTYRRIPYKVCLHCASERKTDLLFWDTPYYNR